MFVMFLVDVELPEEMKGFSVTESIHHIQALFATIFSTKPIFEV